MALGSFLAMAALSLNMQAGKSGQFSMEEAAECAAIYAFTLDAMRSSTDIPANIRMRVRDGLASWEYELSASAPNARPETLQTAADNAVQLVRDNLPEGQGADAAAARGDFLTAGTEFCAAKIASVYGDQEHPVIPFLRQSDAEAGLPVPMPVSQSGGRGLR